MGKLSMAWYMGKAVVGYLYTTVTHLTLTQLLRLWTKTQRYVF